MTCNNQLRLQINIFTLKRKVGYNKTYLFKRFLRQSVTAELQSVKILWGLFLEVVVNIKFCKVLAKHKALSAQSQK